MASIHLMVEVSAIIQLREQWSKDWPLDEDSGRSQNLMPYKTNS